jgi:DNA primase
LPRIADSYVDVESVLEALGLETLGQSGDWAGVLCPFHPEGTPSFSINLEHGGWVDRHEGETTGSLIHLVELLRDCTRQEAADWVRGLSRRQLSSTDALVQLYKLTEPEAPYTEVLEWARRYEELPTNIMSEYFFARGFSKKTMRRFGMRYDDEQSRIICPVTDEDENLLGFIARNVPPNDSRKRYLYPRGMHRTLFPLNHFTGDEAILVEGPLDALWLHQCGYGNALAVLGSSLTREQRSWLRQHVTCVTFVFDNDRDGQLGQRKAAKELGGVPALVVKLPAKAKDVMDLTEEELRVVFEAKRPMLVDQLGGYSRYDETK